MSTGRKVLFDESVAADELSVLEPFLSVVVPDNEIVNLVFFIRTNIPPVFL